MAYVFFDYSFRDNSAGIASSAMLTVKCLIWCLGVDALQYLSKYLFCRWIRLLFRAGNEQIRFSMCIIIDWSSYLFGKEGKGEFLGASEMRSMCCVVIWKPSIRIPVNLRSIVLVGWVPSWASKNQRDNGATNPFVICVFVLRALLDCALIVRWTSLSLYVYCLVLYIEATEQIMASI